MCRPVQCKVCEKTTWAGCGQHVNDVKRSVPSRDWCDGKHAEAEVAAAQKPGFFSRVFGR